MIKQTILSGVILVGLIGPNTVFAFRTCANEATDIYAAATRYVVGEIDFDDATGEASGTETTYNYANRDSEGHNECHVTYELSGIVEPGSGTFVLDAQRTNHSATCALDLLEAKYPEKSLYVLQMTFEGDGTTRVHVADSGEFFANGDWRSGKTAYKTSEGCTVSSDTAALTVSGA